MKLKQIEKLLKASGAKSQLENARLTLIRNAQERLDEEARSLEAQARQSLREEEMTGADIASYGRHQAFVERTAGSKRQDIAELEPHRLRQDQLLRKALQQELSWDRVAADARTAERKEHEARMEERREMLARKR